MGVAFRLGSGSCLVDFHCSDLCIPGINYYTRGEVFGSLRVCCIHCMMGHRTCSVFTTTGV